MSSTYKLGPSTRVFETLENGSQVSFVYTAEMPDGELNQHAGLYRAWLADGNEPEPADPIPEPELTKNEILSLMLADIEPGDEGTTILWIVMQEMLTS